MTDLAFAVVGAEPRAHAVAPTMTFRLRIAERTGCRVHAIALRCQIQIEPRTRRYTPLERERLYELFGEPARWGETMRPLFWTQPVLLVPGFEGEVEADLPVPCAGDLEIAWSKFFRALDGGEIPLQFLFSGTTFHSDFTVEPVPWDREAGFRLPVATWRRMVDAFFPDAEWVRLHRDTFDALHRFKGRRALPTWEAAVTALLAEAGEVEVT
jgi:hypothetical protein